MIILRTLTLVSTMLVISWQLLFSQTLTDPNTLLEELEQRQPVEPEPEKPQVNVSPEGMSNEVDIRRFVLRGVLLSNVPEYIVVEEVKAIFDPYLEKVVTFRDLNTLVKKVNTYFIEQGHFLLRAQVPSQSINNQNGQIQIHVLEGKVGAIHVRGANHYNPDRFVELFDDLVGKTIRKEDMDEKINLLQKYPAIRPKIRFEPGKEYGEADIIIDLHEQPRTTLVTSFDNIGAKSIGKNVLQVGFGVENMTGWADTMVLSASMTEHLSYVAGAYSKLFGESATQISISANEMEIEGDSGALRELTNRWKGRTIGSQPGGVTTADGQQFIVLFPIKLEKFGEFSSRLKKREMRLSRSWFNKENDEFIGSISLTGQDSTSTAITHYLIDYTLPGNEEFLELRIERNKTLDQVRWWTFGFTYIPVFEKAKMQWDLSFELGIEGLGAMSREHVKEGKSSRNQAFSDFRIMKLNYRYNEILPREFEVQFNLFAQIGSELLVSPRKFSAGGAYSVRGYASGEIDGDNGLLANLEVSKLLTTDLSFKLFTDYAQAENYVLIPEEELNPGDPKTRRVRDTISSGGVGLLWGFSVFTTSLEYGKAFNRHPNTLILDNDEQDRGIVYARIQARL